MRTLAEIGNNIARARSFLDQGDVVGIPTETVYGLAANALNKLAVAKIFEVKNRPYFNPLIIHLPDVSSVKKYTRQIPSIAYDLLAAFSPGPLTILLDKSENVPDLVTAGSPKVAIRIPNHPLTIELLQALDYPLAAPSANPFGYVSPTTASHVKEQLGNKIPYILDGGACAVGVESTIVGFEGKELVVYRLGGVPLESLQGISEKIVVRTTKNESPDAPGMLTSHYSPRKMFVVGNVEELMQNYIESRIGVISYSKQFKGVHVNKVLSPNGSLDEAAANLFSAIRELDASDVDVILAEWLPEIGLGRAINDRLNRARLKFD